MHLLLAKGNQISISTKTLQFGSVEKIEVKQAQDVGSTLPGSSFANVDPLFSFSSGGCFSVFPSFQSGASVFFGGLICFRNYGPRQSHIQVWYEAFLSSLFLRCPQCSTPETDRCVCVFHNATICCKTMNSQVVSVCSYNLPSNSDFSRWLDLANTASFTLRLIIGEVQLCMPLIAPLEEEGGRLQISESMKPAWSSQRVLVRLGLLVRPYLKNQKPNKQNRHNQPSLLTLTLESLLIIFCTVRYRMLYNM